MDANKMNYIRNIGIIFGIAIMLTACYLVLSSIADEGLYTGEFIKANKVYMANGNIKLVIYFNETGDTKYFIFDDWKALHSILLSNVILEGDMVEIHFKEFHIFRDFKELTGIEVV